MTVDPQSAVRSNYQYWQEHGSDWGNEYDYRKTHIAYYHIQEVMLSDYATNSGQISLLEYGCGVGRHLQYLSDLPNVEAYGYDQSLTMVENCLRWCTEQWFADHITVGQPVGRLPYPDKYFDIVMTVEVLIHVHPDDLPVILRELVRISKWQVFHLEPTLESDVVSNEHDGCWKHDLVAVYEQLGYSCEALPSGFQQQQPYRVVLDQSRPPYTNNSNLLNRLKNLEQKLQPTLDQVIWTNELTSRYSEQLAQIVPHTLIDPATLVGLSSVDRRVRLSNQVHQQITNVYDEIERLRGAAFRLEHLKATAEHEIAALQQHVEKAEHEIAALQQHVEKAEHEIAGLQQHRNQHQVFVKRLQAMLDQ